MAKMKENSRKVFDYLKEINGSDVTAADVAAAPANRGAAAGRLDS